MKRQRSPRMTPDLAAKVKFLVEKQGLFQHQAAARLGINQGRVSEVMNKKRFADVETPQQITFDFN
ncbi:MAG: hypothetical protein RIB59_11690 [Rhodospirillales bacterium]